MASGAMWIRRSFGNDPLYHTVVQAYIDTLLNKDSISNALSKVADPGRESFFPLNSAS
jgi:hypothetical protein